jgi:glycosyltransferase involved in cell wall biosynthesis
MVSVIIPTYNRSKYICDCIDSVLDQSYQEFEIILIDDGSTDNTREIIQNKYKFEKRLKYIYQNNQERSAARNKGIEESSGEYLAFLDSDDLWHQDKLLMQVTILEKHPTVDMVVTWWNIFDDDGNILQEVYYPETKDIQSGIFSELMVYSNRIGSPTPIIRKSAITGKKLFSDNLTMGEDWEFWTRISIRGKVELVPEIMAYHRVHQNNSEVSMSSRIYIDVIKTLRENLTIPEWKKISSWSKKGYLSIIENETNTSRISKRLHSILWDIKMGYKIF